jgi:hypothetical protein
MALSFSANAENYFFSPNGAGEMDGTSWENAAQADDLPGVISDMAVASDCIYLMAGTYLNKTDVVWTIPQGITIRGGYPAGSKGTNTDITYPSAEETIFTADVDGDGNGDNGTAAFFTIKNVNDNPDMSNFAKTTLAGITIRDAYSTNTSTYKGAAMYVYDANIELDHVKFLNNQNTVAGAVVAFVGSQVYAHDCIWADNQTKSVGVAFIVRQKGGGTTAGVQGSNVIVERCEITNNTVYTPDDSSVAKYGGAIAVADNGGTLYMVNTTVSGSHISWAGAMARLGGNTTFYGIGNTWFDCTCSYTTRHSGDILSCGTGSKIYVAGNIGVTPTDGREGMLATIYHQGGSGAEFEAFYNVFGSMNNSLGNTLDESNDISGDNIESVVFGTNKLADNGGFSKTIAPKADYCKIKSSDIQQLADYWNLPKEIDLTVDQRGYKRGATTYIGAYDVNATATSTGIKDVKPAAVELIVRAFGDGKYQIDGAKGEARVYNIAGKCISSASLDNAGIINLSAAPKGVYILNVGGKSAKLVRF